MEREHRISAGAIVIQADKILLVRYNDSQEKSYLVGPGGGALNDEGIDLAVIREVREETGLEVSPYRVLFIEDLLSKRYRITKIWFLCNLISGRLTRTQGAKEEEIIEVGWYGRNQLNHETVYPAPLLSHSWEDFFKDNWQTLYLELREVDF